MPPSAVPRHPTMADVAERAGVSVSTVSRTLRGLPTVSAEARGRVEEAARELSFVVSRQAAGLVTGRTGKVAVLAPGLRSWFTGSVLTGAQAVLRGAGLELVLYGAADLAERRAFFDLLPARRNADALLVVSFDLTAAEIDRLDGLGVPVVYVSQRAPGRASVFVDDAGAARDGMRHLANLGHRRVAYLCSEGQAGFEFSSPVRLDGCRAALREAGSALPDELVVAVARERTPEDMAVAVGRLLSMPDPPTAVFAETDEVAVQLLCVLRRMGVDVPGRMSVLGFDDHESARWLDLSTIAQPAAEMGREAARLAIGLLEGTEPEPARHVELPTRLVPRGTVAPPAPPAPSSRERS